MVAAALTGAFGLGNFASAATVPIVSPVDIIICHTIVAPYGDTGSHSVTYNAVAGTNMSGSASVTVSGESGEMLCETMSLSSFHFNNDDDFYTGTVTITPSAVPLVVIPTPAQPVMSCILRFRIS